MSRAVATPGVAGLECDCGGRPDPAAGLNPAAEMNSGSERLLKRAMQPEPRRVRAAFSLAEMMIALVILGLGLLFIAAALPAGLDYTRRTVDLATGEAAGEYALDVLRGRVRTSQYLGPERGNLTYPFPFRLDNLVRPRSELPGQAGLGFVTIDGEPFLKVRPLIGMNIEYISGPGVPRYREVPDLGEEFLRTVLTPFISAVGWPPPAPPPQTEYRDFDVPPPPVGSNVPSAMFQSPALSSIVRCYPPISTDDPLTIDSFYPPANPYRSRPIYDPIQNPPADVVLGSETRRAAERLIVWTALYRRVSYPYTEPGGTEVRQGDPTLYEFIAVVVRRPTINHRFPRQDPNVTNPTLQPQALPRGGSIPAELIYPEPWLVSFTRIEQDPPLVWVAESAGPVIDRFLPPTENRAVVRFECAEEVARLLAPGAVVIPAVNDQQPPTGATPPLRKVGFLPHQTAAHPVYEVLEVSPHPSDGQQRVVVLKSNGVYPWTDAAVPPEVWLCWVIPPPFAERDSSGQPIFEKRSAILSVVRQMWRVPEIAGDVP